MTTGSHANTLRRRAKFLKEFVLHPRSTGAVTPSSRFLTRRMVKDARIRPGETVVEYGPGSGPTTRQILHHVKKFDASERPRFFAVEVNADFARELEAQHPDLRVHVGCASRVDEFLFAEGLDGLDVVISGLPWSVFPDELQDRLLQAMLASMRPGGRFVTFTYSHSALMPAARRFRQKIDSLFDTVSTSPVIWRNVPPAFVYCCERAR